MLNKITQYYIILSQPNTRLAFVRNHIHVTPLDTSNFGGSCLFQSEHCKHNCSPGAKRRSKQQES